MILIVGIDEVFAKWLTRELGQKKVTHVASVEEALQILSKESSVMLILIGEAKTFRKLKSYLLDQPFKEQFPSFLIHANELDVREVVASYNLGVGMVFKRTDDLADILRKFT